MRSMISASVSGSSCLGNFAMGFKPIDFQFYGGAIDDPDTPRSVFTAIGKAAVAWGRLETHLDAIIIQINKKEHSEKLYSEHPSAFDKKIDVIKRWFNQYPPLAEHKALMRDLTSTLRLISKNARNPLIHSIFASYDPAKKMLTLQSIKSMKNDEFRLREEQITLQFVIEFYKAVNTGNLMLSSISKRLFSPDAEQLLGKR